MEKRKGLQWSVFVASFGVGLAIVLYYWTTSGLEGIRNAPLHVMLLCTAYILLQVGRRFLFSRQFWWDWLYYIGLLAIVTPVFWATENNVDVFSWCTDIGTVFLIVPVLLDGMAILKGTP